MIIKRKNTEKFELNKLSKLARYFKLDINIIKLIFMRGFKTKEEIENFLNPPITSFHDPYLLNNMKEVVSRVKEAIEKKKRITILGDYDTDGISATAIMYKFFASKGLIVNTFLPNRIADGYGLSRETIDKVKKSYRPDLILTVDCGISAHDEIEYAKSLGIEVIVTDHHDVPEIVPECLIINAKMPNQKYPFTELCGAGVALKLVQAIDGVDNSLKYLTIASLATVADIVPLVDENRLITYHGLKRQKEDMPIGLQKLIKKLKLETPLASSDISFKLAPKINATGRMGKPNIAFNLYIMEDIKDINNNIEILLELNDKRVNETNNIVEEAVAMIDKVDVCDQGIIIAKNETWESGVLGIICSKLVDMYNRPACVLSMIDGELKGSIRSIPSINIYEALTNVKDYLVQYGGHNQAAGVTIKPENFDMFCKKINEYILSTHTQNDYLIEKKYDLDMSKVNLTDKFISQLKVLEPYGLMNEKPLFKIIFNNAIVTPMSKYPNHIKTKVNGLELVGFNLGEYIYNFNTNSNKEVIVEVGLDRYAGKERPKGIIKYISFSKLNTTVKTEIVNGLYLNQLKYIDVQNQTDRNAVVMNDAELYSYFKTNNQSNKFGTLVISNSIDSYNNFINAVPEIKNFELYNINNKTGINTIIFAPFDNLNLVNYKNIILLDAPIHAGYINHLLNLGKNVILRNVNFDKSVLKNIDSSRAVFGKYHNIIKSSIKNNKDNLDILSFYNKLKKLNPHFSSSKFNEFMFVILVLEQLGICKICGGDIEFTDIKSNLKDSSIYNFINLLLNTMR